MKKFMLFCLIYAGFSSASSMTAGMPYESLSCSKGKSLYFQIDVPEGTTSLSVRTDGGHGNVDLYVSVGQSAVPGQAPFSSARNGNDELIYIENPEAGTYFLTLFANRDFRNVSLLADYDYLSTREFDFNVGVHAWAPDFSGFSIMDDPAYLALGAGIESMPRELGRGRAMKLQGRKALQQLFMFLKRHFGPEDGVVPNKYYEVQFQIKLASNGGAGCFGRGGVPGESVFLKAGAVGYEPKCELIDNYYQVNLDFGFLEEDGYDMTTLGNVANDNPCDDDSFRSLYRSGSHTYPVQADENGNLWVIVGTHSNYDDLSRVFIQDLEVTLIPVQ